MARISWLQSSLFHLQRDRLHGAGSDKGTMPDLVGFDQRNQYIQLLRTQADTQSRAFRKGLCTVAPVHPMQFTAWPLCTRGCHWLSGLPSARSLTASFTLPVQPVADRR